MDTNAATSTAPASSTAATPFTTMPFVAPTAGLPIPAATLPPVDPNGVGVIDTSFGRIVIQLDDFVAQKTCDSFRKLVSSGFYNTTIFHRVIPKFIIQGGDPNPKSPNRARYGRVIPATRCLPKSSCIKTAVPWRWRVSPDTVNP